MNTKLSVIILFHNAGKYLCQTLDSVLNQSLEDIEILCADVNSSDNSVSVVQDYSKKDPRVKLVDQKAKTYGEAGNAGLSDAAGEYVHFLKAEDYVLQYAYEAAYNKVKRYDLDILKFPVIPFDETNGRTVEIPEYTFKNIKPEEFHRLLECNEKSRRMNLAPIVWNTFFRRSFLEEIQVKFAPSDFLSERPFFWRTIISADRVMLCRDRVLVHCVDDSNYFEVEEAADYYNRQAIIRTIYDQMTEDGVSGQLLYTIMKKEFNEMMEVCKKLTSKTKSEELLAKTEEYLSSYSFGFMRGYIRTIQTLRRDLVRDDKVPAYTEKHLPERRFFYEPCKNPKVSVVVPLFNQEEYLNEALDSLVNQSLQELEIIVVNDGSTDHSMTILKEYAENDKRIRIIDKANSGYGHSMNVGIDAATGTYLGILEPDDYVPLNMFEDLAKAADKAEADFVKANFNRFVVNEDGVLEKTLFRLTSDASYYGRVINPAEEREVLRFVMNTWSGIYRLSFLNKWHIRHNETPGASYQDNGFYFQTFCRAQRVWFVNKAYYMNRRDNPNSSMFSKKKFYAVTEEYRFIYDFLHKDWEHLKIFEPYYYSRKLSNFVTTYYRLDKDSKQDYLHHICEEFKEPYEQGLIDQNLVGRTQWQMLTEILEDPDQYYNKIKVSVIVPVYNSEKYLRAMLDSILVKDQVRMEMICVDDGSTDGSAEILRQYEEKDYRVRVIRQENAGAGAARNNGMQYASGEYLMFLDADDIFHTEMIRRVYEKAHLEAADMVVFRSNQYIESERVYREQAYTIRKDLLPLEQPFAGEEIREDVFKAFVGWPWDKMFKADFVREHSLKFQEQRTSNDMLFVFSAVLKAKRIVTMDAILATHRRSDKSLSVTREESWPCFYNALIALRDQMKDWNLYERYERDYINYALHFSLWNLNTIKGSAYEKLYQKLKTEWFSELGIASHSEMFYYNMDEYQQYCAVMNMEPDDYLFHRLDLVSQKNTELSQRVKTLQGTEKKLKKENTQKNQKVNRLNKKVAALQESTSFKVGSVITWLPRNIKESLKNKTDQ